MLPSGKKVGPYEIVRPIGAGGMGEVYCAKDPRLSRLVAIKLLSSRIPQDSEPLRRFRKEAEAIGSLNHPNILTIHDVGIEEGIPYLVTELLQGETLRHVLSKGALDLKNAKDIALQFANALAAAHEKGIIHRDLKPENLFITKDGRLKILDFGLAKLTEKLIPATDFSETPTASAITEAGIVLGTVAYMSPEQVRAMPLDQRSDIFSFGSILYEMLCGRRAFSKDSKVETMNAILHQQPLFTPEVENKAPGLVTIAKRCLEKDVDHRFHSAIDVGFALEAISGNKNVSATTRDAKPKKYVAAFIALMIIGAIAVILFRRNQKLSETSMAPVILGFEQLTNQAGLEARANISPNGKQFVYSALNERDRNLDIYLQRVGGRNPVNLTDWCEQDDNDAAFSPDGDQIAFRSSCEGGGLFLMGATGESVRRISEFGANPAWSSDGKKIAFGSTGMSMLVPWLLTTSESQIWILDLASGRKQLLSSAHGMQPSWSPAGHRIAYWGVQWGISNRRDIWTISSSGGSPVSVTNDQSMDCNPIWSPDGRFLYFNSNRGGSLNLWRVKIEEQTGKTLSSPEPVTTPSSEINYLSFSKNGKNLLFSSLFWQDNMEKLTFDPNQERIIGATQAITTGTKKFKYPDPSPDGKWLACNSWRELNQDIYIMHPDGTDLRQLTNDAYVDRFPKWSRDGNKIAFLSDRGGKAEIWSINRDGTGLQQLTDTSQPKLLPLWSPDDSKIVASPNVNVDSNEVLFDISGKLPINKWEKLPDVPQKGESFAASSWSGDGKWLAGISGIRSDSLWSVVLYSFESRRYTTITEREEADWQFLTPVWLHDNRRLLFGLNNRLVLWDSGTKKSKTITTFDRPTEVSWFRISNDDRTIYYQRATTEGDIWLLKFK